MKNGSYRKHEMERFRQRLKHQVQTKIQRYEQLYKNFHLTNNINTHIQMLFVYKYIYFETTETIAIIFAQKILLTRLAEKLLFY